jgi:thymidylate synthase
MLNNIQNTSHIRQTFGDLLKEKEFTISRLNDKTIEIMGASFLANEDHIFGEPNKDYIAAEIQWYESESTNINDIYGEDAPPPAAWKIAANDHGEINSNYGFLMFNRKFFKQASNAINELINNEDTRRAIMIYNRPSMWVEYDENDKNDFVCTNAVTYYIRDGKINCVVQMRSNDAWAGYRNDWAWQRHMLEYVTFQVNNSDERMFHDALAVGDIIWQVQNLHVYERNFYLVDLYNRGLPFMSKKEYREKFPDSEYTK